MRNRHTKCAATHKCSTTAQPEQRGRLWTSWTHVYCVLQLRRKMVVVRKQPFRHSDTAVSVIEVNALPEHRGRLWTTWTHVYCVLRIRRWTMCVHNHFDMTVILLDKLTTRRFNCTAVVIKRRGCDLACWCARTPSGPTHVFTSSPRWTLYSPTVFHQSARQFIGHPQ